MKKISYAASQELSARFSLRRYIGRFAAAILSANGNARPLQVGIALLMPFAAAGLQWYFWEFVRPLAWFLFFPAVFFASWVGGRIGGQLATVISILLVLWLFLPPENTFVKEVNAYLSASVFLGMGALFSAFHGKLREANRKVSETLAAAELSNIELSNRERFIRTITDALPSMVGYWDKDLRCRFANHSYLMWFGKQPEAMIGTHIRDLLGERLFGLNEPYIRGVLAGNEQHFERTLIKADGTIGHTWASYIPDRDALGAIVGFFVLVSDVTLLREAEAELRLTASVFQNTLEGIIITDASVNIVSVNAALINLSGFPKEELIGSNPRILKSERHDEAFWRHVWESLHATGQWQGEIWNRRKDGELYPVRQNIGEVRDSQGQVVNYISVLSDISDIKRAEADLTRLAHYDELTDLPNRRQFEKTLVASLERAKRNDGKLAVLFIDLDNFKLINDSMGHAAGDQLLRTVANRLTGCVRGQDTVARLGGDEFTVVLDGIAHADDAAGVAQKIIAAIGEPMEVDGKTLASSVSVGISIYPADAQTAELLIRNADAALYRAKGLGRNTFEFYFAELTAHSVARLALEHDLRQAMANDELALYYQPQYAADASRLCGMEALLRWHHPERGTVLPAEFIGIAEESHLIVPLGAWVIDRACRQMRAWLDAGLQPVRIAINVSGREILHGHLVDTIQAVLETYNLQPGDIQLEIEVTESVLISTKQSGGEFARLRALGVTISIDDFGTGYSSLSTLRYLPVHAIKIAQVFMDGVPENEDNTAILMAVLAVARSMRLRVIAEGVENQAQLEFLREHGCDEIQGFIFSAAIPEEKAALLLKPSRLV